MSSLNSARMSSRVGKSCVQVPASELTSSSHPEFREYILIDQYSYHIEQFATNSKGKWVLTEYDSDESVLTLESVEFQMPLREIYERINFEVEDEEVNQPTSDIQE